MRWLTEPGWLTLQVEAPTLLMMATDQSHFSRAFLKVVGLTPTAWLHSRS